MNYLHEFDQPEMALWRNIASHPLNDKKPT